MIKRLSLFIIISICVLSSGAQTLTATYIALADSADYYIDRKMWTHAERVIIKALRHEPANKSNYLLWSNLGMVREQTGNYPGAVESYTIGLASAPRSTVLLTNRARAYLSEGKSDEALKDLSAALEVDSTLRWPLKMRGFVYASKGKLKEALNDLIKYESCFGADSDIAEVKGDVYILQGDFEKALEEYKKANDSESNPELIIKMATSAYNLGRIEDMAEVIAQGIKNHPREGELYLLRALINKARYQTKAYESDIETAKRLGVAKSTFSKYGIN